MHILTYSTANQPFELNHLRITNAQRIASCRLVRMYTRVYVYIHAGQPKEPPILKSAN